MGTGRIWLKGHAMTIRKWGLLTSLLMALAAILCFAAAIVGGNNGKEASIVFWGAGGYWSFLAGFTLWQTHRQQKLALAKHQKNQAVALLETNKTTNVANTE